MKRILLFLFVASFLMAGLANADSNYAYDNVVILGPRMGAEGISPPVEVIKVSTGSNDSGDVGDVMVWDLARSDGSGLGFVVHVCDRNTASDDMDASEGKGPFAGVMITSCSKETEWTTAVGGGETVGYMAIRGYVDAKVITADATVGENLVLKGVAEAGHFGTIKKANTQGVRGDLSDDIGYLLEDTGVTAGLMKVWLR